MNSPLDRDWKGVWIPKWLYTDDSLRWTEKLLLLEINSLDRNKGCFASNRHLASFLNKEIRYVKALISRLRDLGYIEEEISESGNRRILRLTHDIKASLNGERIKLNKSLVDGQSVPIRNEEAGEMEVPPGEDTSINPPSRKRRQFPPRNGEKNGQDDIEIEDKDPSLTEEIIKMYGQLIGNTSFKPKGKEQLLKFVNTSARMHSNFTDKLPKDKWVWCFEKFLTSEYIKKGKVIYPGNLCSGNLWSVEMPQYLSHSFGI